MSAHTIALVIAAVLFLHGIAHLGALAALIANGRGVPTDGWRAAHSWLVPSLSPRVAAMVAAFFWILSAIAFVLAGIAFWRASLPPATWSQLALASALISTVGILLFWRNWPTFNTLAAMAVNLAVLVTQFMAPWPLQAFYGA